MEIDARTKVGALLSAHPELEEPLIEFVPAFARLRNPILRATVARLATLEQAARVGGVALPDLVLFLRRRLGQEEEPAAAGAAAPEAATSWPEWFDPQAVVARLDASSLLERGLHPLAQVKKALAAHPAGGIVVVLSDFEPAPLIDQLTREGFLAACRACREDGRGYETAFRRGDL